MESSSEFDLGFVGFDDFDDVDEDNVDQEENHVEVLDGDDIEIQKRSDWWVHFDEVNDENGKYAKCKHCDKGKYKITERSNGSTGNMKRHTIRNHPEKVLQVNMEEKKFVFSQELFRETLLKWVVICDQPFSEIGQPSFIELIKTLNPEAELVSDKTIRSDLMAMYEKKLQELKILLAAVPGKISLTMDGWTSKNSLPFAAIRGHWINKDCSYQSKLLDFPHIVGDHSGLSLKKILVNCLTRLEISMAKILGITLDNAFNNDTLLFWLEEHGLSSLMNQVRCLDHIMNLAVQDILTALKVPYCNNCDETDPLETEVLDDIDMDEEIITSDTEDDENDGEENEIIIVKLRTLMKKIRKSVQMRQKLKKCCEIYNVKYLVPILDVSNRWNSSHDMIVRGKYLKFPLRALCNNEKTLSKYQINENEWTQLKEIDDVLAKFKRATLLMSMERHPIIPSYLPTFDWLLSILQKCVDKKTILSNAARQGLLKLKKYQLDINKSFLPFIATVIHPGLKLNYFKEHNYPSSQIRDIKKKVSDYFLKEYKAPLDNSESSESEKDELFAHMFKRSKVEKFPSEFEKYLQLPLSDKKVQPLEYWKSQTVEFPLLSKMAMDVLPVQGSSIAVERDFSKAARVVPPSRSALKPDVITASMCLKSWLQ